MRPDPESAPTCLVAGLPEEPTRPDAAERVLVGLEEDHSALEPAIGENLGRERQAQARRAQPAQTFYERVLGSGQLVANVIRLILEHNPFYRTGD